MCVTLQRSRLICWLSTSAQKMMSWQLRCTNLTHTSMYVHKLGNWANIQRYTPFTCDFSLKGHLCLGDEKILPLRQVPLLGVVVITELHIPHVNSDWLTSHPLATIMSTCVCNNNVVMQKNLLDVSYRRYMRARWPGSGDAWQDGDTVEIIIFRV